MYPRRGVNYEMSSMGRLFYCQSMQEKLPVEGSLYLSLHLGMPKMHLSGIPIELWKNM